MYSTPDSYTRQAVLTATPAQLVLMLFDGAITAIGKARFAHAQGYESIEIVNRELQRVQAIVDELHLSLDQDNGQPIAGNLALLYAHCQGQLLQANVTKDLVYLDSVENTLSELREAWDEACVQGAPEVAANPQFEAVGAVAYG